MPNPDAAQPTIVHNAAERRFEAALDHGEFARADYRLDGGVMRIVHTEVPPAYEGRGIAGSLMRAAIAHARVHRLRVQPACSYARSYMKRHPESHDLLPADSDL